MESLTEDEITKIPTTIKKRVTEIISFQGNELLVHKVFLQNKEKELETFRIETNHQLSQLKKSLEDKTKQTISLEEDRNNAATKLKKVEDEFSKLQEQLNESEKNFLDTQRQLLNVTNERDQFSYMVDRRNEQIERLQKDLQDMEKLLTPPTNDNHGITNSLKETMLEQERQYLFDQQTILKRKLDRNEQELLAIKRECSLKIMTVENKLHEKIEDLRLAKATINQLEKLNESLMVKTEDLVVKNKTDSDEMKKMIEFYERELQSQKRLVQLHKESTNESTKQIEKLTSAVSELQSLLYDNTNEHSEVETHFKTKEAGFFSEIQTKDATISNLQEEISILTQLVKSTDFERVNTKTNTTGNPGLSMTEIYCAYVKATEQLLNEKQDNEKLRTQLKNILCEIEERAPMLKQNTIEYQTLVDANIKLTSQLESIMSEKNNINNNLEGVLAKLSFLERENSKLNRERGDLGRQVCHLLKEIELLRGGLVSDEGFAMCHDANADEVITKRLVTFSNIKELQENNTKLLLLVRDLSSKLEEIEETQQTSHTSKFEEKMNSYLRKIEDLTNSQEKQTQMIKSCIDQRDRYKDLYLESLKDPKSGGDGLNKQINSDESSSKLNEKVRQLQETSDEFEQYRKETQNNIKLTNEENENLRSELRELTTKNYKLASSVEFKIEQLKLNEKTTEMHKKQIETLETRNRNYETIISKQELNIKSMSDELYKLQNQRASDDVMMQHLKRENEYLRGSESRLVSEKQLLDRESHNQQLLLQNLESIKSNLQKSENEGRLRLERNLEEATRECYALRRHLQEETSAYKAKIVDLEKQYAVARDDLMAKNNEMSSLQSEILVLKDTLTQKVEESQQFERQSANSNNVKNKVDSQKEQERKMQEQLIEIESLKRELSLTRNHCKQYCQMAEHLEKELKSTSLLQKEESSKLNAQIHELKKENKKRQDKIADIEEQLIIQIAKPIQSNNKNDIAKLQEELQDLIEKHKEANKELRYLRDHCSQLTIEIQKTEQKYANEMILHSADVQALASLKEDYQKLLDEMNILKATKNTSNEQLVKRQELWNEHERQLKEENDNLKLQLSNLQKHNELLHNQIQELSNNCSVLLSKDKSDDQADKLFESKSSEELLQIINYLRKEKNLVASKCDLIENESSRIKMELEILKKNHEELKQKLNSERIETEIIVSSSNKHEELLRKLEMINAITDSNRVLREERDSISKRLSHTVESLQKLEAALAPLQEKNQELQSKIKALSNENSSLRIEATRWKLRADTLVERSNKISVDDLKKLTLEKENLAKLLSTEKESSKRQLDEFNVLRAEKMKLESEIAQIKKSNQVAEAEYSKELSAIREALQKLQTELRAVHVTVLEKEGEISKLTEENASKESQLTELRNKEQKVRQIAKRYKDSYVELRKQVDEKNIDLTLTTQAEAVDTDDNSSNLAEENNSLKREIEVLRVNLEKEERNRNLLREAKQRIIALQAANKELQSKKLEMDVSEAATFSSADHGNSEGKHLQSTIISHLTKENEVLTTKVTQLNRQIALQSVKPMPASTSSDKTISEPLRTANVKPITPSTTQNTSSITSWRGSETPLASIRPMTVQSGRSIAVIPGTATTTDATTSTNNYEVSCVNVSNSVPSAAVVATVPPLGSIEDSAEGLQCTLEESNSSTGSTTTVHHTVALISPRIEQAHSNEATFSQPSNTENENKTPVATTSLQPASSSSVQPSTTTHLNTKRGREVDLVNAQDESLENPLLKKSRLLEGGELKPSVTKFTSEIEYQVPTSSQHDHEEDIIEIEEDREVSVQFQVSGALGSGSNLKDAQKKEEVTSAQNTVEEYEGDATSTDANNVNTSSSNNWYSQTDKRSATINTPLHTTMNEENSLQCEEDSPEQGSSNVSDQSVKNDDTNPANKK